jgi:hypothetical protein
MEFELTPVKVARRSERKEKNVLLTRVHPVISHYPGAVFDYPKIRKKGEF